MQTNITTQTFARTSATTRRSFLKTVVAGAATSALLVTGLANSAAGPRPNRETGSAPVLGEPSAFRSGSNTQVNRKRYERRSPE
jgi:hypothetical protein